MHKIQRGNFLLNLYKAWQDLTQSFKYWRIFYIIGISDIRKRYARSKIGQFWLTLSLFINVATIGIVWSYLFKLPISEYLPFLAIGTIFWQYMLSLVNEGATVYINFSSYLRELSIPKLAYVNGLIMKNLVILGHNLLVLIPIYLFCAMPVSIMAIMYSLFGLVLTSLFLFPIIIFIGIVSLRFRDMPSIITSIMQVVFYVTPIMWKVNLIPDKYHHFLILNPFAVFISICRDPLFTLNITSNYLIAAVIYIILAWFVAFLLFSKFRSRIVYWL